MSSSSERQEMESTSSRGIEGSYPAQAFHAINLITPDHTNHQNMPAETLTVPDNEAGSLRSASSVETFQSAISVQESIDIALQVEAVCDVLHSFRTALEVLAALIETRLRKKEKHTYAAAKELEDSLAKGEKEITELHNQHRKRHGLLYTTGFTASRKLALMKYQTVAYSFRHHQPSKCQLYSSERYCGGTTCVFCQACQDPIIRL